MKKYKFYNLSPVEVYNMVLRGDAVKRVPQGFWQGKEGLENAKKLIKYLFEERLEWNDEQVLKNLSAKVFYDNRLGGMLQILFDSHPIEAYNFAYPGKFKPWEFRQVPANFWSRETGIAATKWLIEEKLKWSDNEVIEKLTWKDQKNEVYGVSINKMG